MKVDPSSSRNSTDLPLILFLELKKVTFKTQPFCFNIVSCIKFFPLRDEHKLMQKLRTDCLKQLSSVVDESSMY